MPESSFSSVTEISENENSSSSLTAAFQKPVTTVKMSIFRFDAVTGQPSLWIFGYGSLMWNPGFEFTDVKKCTLPGFARRFWHGNMAHRGTKEQPGRVVTLVRHQNASTAGLIFRVSGADQINSALKHLHYREIENGYEYESVDVDLNDADADEPERVHVLTCIAHVNRRNESFVGRAREKRIAAEIATAVGWAGANHEYLTKLADCQRKLFPDVDDRHLYTIERLVHKRLTATTTVQ